MTTLPQRVHRRHPARQAQSIANHPSQRQPVSARHPRHAPQVQRRRGSWWRLLLLLLAIPALLWAYAQAPRLLPFTARHGGNSGLLLLAVLALVVLGGLKTVIGFKTMRHAVPAASDD